MLDTHPAVSSNFFSSGMVFPESRSPTSDKSSPLFFLTNSFLAKGRVSRTDTPSLGDPVTGILIRPLRTWCLVNRSEMSGGRASPQSPFSRPANTHQHLGPAGRQDSNPANTHQHPGPAAGKTAIQQQVLRRRPELRSHCFDQVVFKVLGSSHSPGLVSPCYQVVWGKS